MSDQDMSDEEQPDGNAGEDTAAPTEQGLDMPEMGGAAGAASQSKSGRKILYWYDPMMPDRHFDKPGKSPFMDMQLVPKYANEAATGSTPCSPASYARRTPTVCSSFSPRSFFRGGAACWAFPP